MPDSFVTEIEVKIWHSESTALTVHVDDFVRLYILVELSSRENAMQVMIC